MSLRKQPPIVIFAPRIQLVIAHEFFDEVFRRVHNEVPVTTGVGMLSVKVVVVCTFNIALHISQPCVRVCG
jgi:hypothetical protein